MTYRIVSVKADGTGDYTTLGNAINGLISITQNGDTSEIVLYDVSCEAYTWINYYKGSNWILKSNNPINADGTGGTRMFAPAHGLRVLGSQAAAGSANSFTFEGLKFNSNDFGNYYEYAAIAPNYSISATYKNCYWSGYDGTESCLRIYGSQTSISSLNLYLENCVWVGCRDKAIISAYNTASGVSINILQKRCTMVDSSFNVSRDTNMNVTIQSIGSILDPYTTASEIVIGGTGGTLNASADYCIFTRTEANVSSSWDSTLNSAYNVSLVTGDPAAGQVGFTNIATGDLTLYNSTNNLAIDFVQSGSMPSTDINGTSIPQGPYADAGAYEVIQITSFTYFLPISVVY